MRSKDGRVYIVRAHPDRTGADRIGGAGMTFLDITSRQHADKALRESEQRLALAFAALPIGIRTTDPGGNMVILNELMRRLLPTGTIPSRGLDDDSKEIWTEVRYEPPRDIDGKISGALIVMIDGERMLLGDVAEHTRAAIAHMRAERRAENILEHMGDAHSVLDRDYRIVGVNAAADRRHARTPVVAVAVPALARHGQEMVERAIGAAGDGLHRR